MSQQFIIPDRLPGLNDYTRANRTGPQVGARMKRKAEEQVAAAVVACKVQPMDGMVRLHIDWYEHNAARDADNVSFAVKFVLDTLVRLGIMPDDDRKHFTRHSHQVHVDKDNPRVVVRMEEDE